MGTLLPFPQSIQGYDFFCLGSFSNSNTETFAVLALTLLQYIQIYISVLRSLIPAWSCGPQKKKTTMRKKIPEMEEDLTPDR